MGYEAMPVDSSGSLMRQLARSRGEDEPAKDQHSVRRQSRRFGRWDDDDRSRPRHRRRGHGDHANGDLGTVLVVAGNHPSTTWRLHCSGGTVEVQPLGLTLEAIGLPAVTRLRDRRVRPGRRPRVRRSRRGRGRWTRSPDLGWCARRSPDDRARARSCAPTRPDESAMTGTSNSRSSARSEASARRSRSRRPNSTSRSTSPSTATARTPTPSRRWSGRRAPPLARSRTRWPHCVASSGLGQTARCCSRSAATTSTSTDSRRE